MMHVLLLDILVRIETKTENGARIAVVVEIKRDAPNQKIVIVAEVKIELAKNRVAPADHEIARLSLKRKNVLDQETEPTTTTTTTTTNELTTFRVDQF
jgi:hypothetical protein